MNLLPHLIVRLFGITARCLIAAIAWTVVDAHRSIEREAELSAARVGQHLQALYWQEQLWRGRGRTGLNTAAPEWESFTTLGLISPGVRTDAQRVWFALSVGLIQVGDLSTALPFPVPVARPLD